MCNKTTFSNLEQKSYMTWSMIETSFSDGLAHMSHYGHWLFWIKVSVMLISGAQQMKEGVWKK